MSASAGLFVAEETIGRTVHQLYNLERAARIQVLAMSSGRSGSCAIYRPRPGGRFATEADAVKLAGRPGYRVRVGAYRVIFERHGDGLIVLDVGHRREVYR
jgi:hypothetical protein